MIVKFKAAVANCCHCDTGDLCVVNFCLGNVIVLPQQCRGVVLPIFMAVTQLLSMGAMNILPSRMCNNECSAVQTSIYIFFLHLNVTNV